MRPINRTTLALSTAAAVTALAACSGSGSSGDADYVDGGTFVQVLSSDPGNLDPHSAGANPLLQVSYYAYDRLVNHDQGGEIVSGLATAWEQDGLEATLTIGDDITCSDGEPFTAQTAARNIEWIADPDNLSPWLGSLLPIGVTAEAADDTLTLTVDSPEPFLFHGLAKLTMVCDAGLDDRSILASETNGTGPYVLTEVIPDERYEYEVREDYTWGPDGATTAETGMPAAITARIVTNETTAANMLLAGEVNAASIVGADAGRLEGAGLFLDSITVPLGLQWYNHIDGHPTADPAVRLALTQALDLEQLRNVVTSGDGSPGTGLAIIAPAACEYDAVGDSLPSTDVAAAESTLDDAGWTVGSDGVREKDGQRLALTFLYNAGLLGDGGTSGAELATQAWEAIGIEVDVRQQDGAAIQDSLYGSGAWDIVWLPSGYSTPDQVAGLVSGPSVPEGTNFAGIQNEEYEAAVEDALQLEGEDNCAAWEDAERALYRDADLVPFANSEWRTFGNGAEFEFPGTITPTSIRMVGS